MFRDALPLVNSGRIELLDDPKLIGQLSGLERRAARGSRESIDHGPGGHDDRANAAAGALVQALASSRPSARMFDAFTGRPISARQFDPIATLFPRDGDPLER